MYPTLFEVPLLGRMFAIDARGLCITIGALVALITFARRARGSGLDPSEARELGLELLLVGLVAARLVYVTWHARDYVTMCNAAMEAHEAALAACTRPLWIWEGGLSPIGGLALAFSWLLWRSRQNALAPLAVADLAAPPLAIAYAIGRIGCFFAGCCFGRVTQSVFGVRLPPESVAFQVLVDRGRLAMSAAATPPLHPVALYCACLLVLLSLGLVLVTKRAHRYGDGVLFLGFLLGSALISIVLAPFYDPAAVVPLWLTLVPPLSLAAVVGVMLRRRA